MKRLIISVVGAAVIGTGLALAPPAHADYVTDAFLAEVRAEGFVGTYTGDAALVSNGIGVCSRLDAGWGPYQVVNWMYTSTSMTAYEAGKFSGIAVRRFCPQWTSEMVGWALGELSPPQYGAYGDGIGEVA